MKRSRFSKEQIIGIEGARGRRVGGRPVPKTRVSDPSIYKWKAKFGGMDVSDAAHIAETPQPHRQSELTTG